MDDIKKYNEFFDSIKEGLIKTYPLLSTIKLISRELSLSGYKFSIDKDDTTDTIFIKLLSNGLTDKYLIKLLRSINLCGYFISNYDFYDKSDQRIGYLIHKDLDVKFLEEFNKKCLNSFFTQITIESKFNKKVLVDGKLYHLTLLKNKESIEKYGLVPKSRNKRANHNGRIYFGFNKIITKNLSYQFGRGDYILLEIDNINPDITFYDDPDFTNNGVWTYENITPDKIKIIDTFKI